MESQDNEVRDLSNQEAINKMKELVEHANICFFVTLPGQDPLAARPMATQQVDNEGTFWFFSGQNSQKNFDIGEDARVQLFYSNPSKYEFLSVYGRAAVSRDRNRIEELWTPVAKAWFKEGKNDPSITLIQVVPDQAYYWDTKNNKVVSFLKILASMVSDKSMDDGVMGKLKV